MIQAVIWDFGGVLVRTEDKIPRTRLAERLGLTYAQIDQLVFGSPSAFQGAVGEISAVQHWQSICQTLNLPVEQAARLRQEFFAGDRLDQELVGYIRSLRPRYRTALLSNAWDDLRQDLEQLGLLDVFDETIISAEVRLRKPDLHIFQLAINRLGVNPAQAVFVDDFLENITAARQAGLAAIHFQNPEQARQELETLLVSVSM